MKMSVQASFQVPAFNSFGYTPKTGIARSYGNSMFNFLSICHTFFSMVLEFLTQIYLNYDNMDNKP